MAMIMMKEKKLPHEFWSEAVDTAAYILNRCPTKKIETQVPKQVWSRRKSSVAHFKIVGS
jgi:hypothetical protein